MVDTVYWLACVHNIMLITFSERRISQWRFALPSGRLKKRNLTSRDHQNCGVWPRETGQRETIIARVDIARP